MPRGTQAHRPVLALLIALLVPTPAVQAQTAPGIDEFATQLQAELANLAGDPFDPQSLTTRRQALLARQVGRELRIPAPSKGMDRVGAEQGLWPLRYQDGQLRLEFSTSNSLSYGPMLADAPWNYWTSDFSRQARGETASDGRACRQYSRRSGYGLFLESPREARYFVDDQYRVPGSAPSWRFQPVLSELAFESRLERVKALAGRLETRVRLAALNDIQRMDGNEVQATQSRHCYSGSQTMLQGRIDQLRLIDRSSGEDVVRIRFSY